MQHKVSVSINPSILPTFDCGLTTLRLRTHDPATADFVHKTTHSRPCDCIITLVRVVIIHVFLYAKNALKNVKSP